VGERRFYRCVLNAEGATQQISAPDSGNRGVGTLTYQWQRSAGNSDADYSDIPGATSSTYNDTDAPAFTVKPPSSVTAEAISSSVIRISYSGASVVKGETRYYRCYLSAEGASSVYSSPDRGYRDDTLASSDGYEIFSDSDPEGTYSTSEGLDTASPFDDTGLSPGTTKYYKVRAKSSSGVWSDKSSVYDGATTWTVPTVVTNDATGLGLD